MGRKKLEPTHIKSLRVDTELKDFLESLDNANIFVIQLLRECDEFKKYAKNEAKNNCNTNSLFDEVFEEDTKLKVPFEQKEEFKEVANNFCNTRKYDPLEQVWIVQKGTLKAPFLKWIID